MHFYLGRPTAGTVRFAIHLTDESKPKGSPERRTTVFATRPLATEDFARWGEWIKSNLPELLHDLLGRFCESARLMSHGDLLKDGWSGLPTSEILTGDCLKRDELRLSETAYMEALERWKLVPTEVMYKAPQDAHEEEVLVAFRVSKPLNPPKRIEPLQTEAPPNVDDKVLSVWVDRQRAGLGDPPYYLVCDPAKLKQVLISIIGRLLDGGKSAFFDRDIKDFLANVQTNLERYLTDPAPGSLSDLLNFNPKRLATPEEARQVAAENAAPKTT